MVLVFTALTVAYLLGTWNFQSQAAQLWIFGALLLMTFGVLLGLGFRPPPS